MENVSVAIDAGRIISLVATSEVRENFSASEEITLDRHIVMPGLLMHTVKAQCAYCGVTVTIPEQIKL